MSTILLASLVLAASALSTYSPYVATPLLCLLVGYIYAYPWREWRLACSNVPGPSTDGSIIQLLFGHLVPMFNGKPGEWDSQQLKEYGLTYRSRLLFGKPMLATVDPTAVGYIYRNTDLFARSSYSRETLRLMLGNGLLVAEGDAHTRQRRILSYAFGTKQIYAMAPTFYDKAEELADKLALLVDQSSESSSPSVGSSEKVFTDCASPKAAEINLLVALTEFTLDVIGKIGFDYNFNALKNGQDSNELARLFAAMVDGLQFDPLFSLQTFFPSLQLLPSRGLSACRRSEMAATPVATALMERKIKDIKADESSKTGTDLLSLLIRANMAENLPESQRLSKEEVISQVTTFMFAGNETSSTALSWILHQLSLNPDVQDRLRDEFNAVPMDRPSSEEILQLPYLDAVVRETLRYNCPVSGTFRRATTDLAIPLEVPVRGRDGKMMDAVPVQKGQDVWISALGFNHLPEMWGQDAMEFNPDRWAANAGGADLDGQAAADQHDRLARKPTAESGPGQYKVAGTWSNMLTFLGGPRICIGMRLALLEIKIALFVLLRRFSFKPVPGIEIESVTSVVIRPKVKGREGLQLPLLVTPLETL